MKKSKNIHNLDNLEKEIYRLRLEAMRQEKKLSDNMAYLRENANSLIIHSVFCRKKTTFEKKNSEEEGFFKNERFNSMINRIKDRIANRAADGIESLLDRLFHKRKHHTNE